HRGVRAREGHEGALVSGREHPYRERKDPDEVLRQTLGHGGQFSGHQRLALWHGDELGADRLLRTTRPGLPTPGYLFHDTGFKPLVDHTITHPLLDERTKLRMIERIEK
ncbi:MAG: hypothetical protein L0Y67_05210, partial [Gammaproteobacteria bacterium]|nr:hypothetical protein [Gammaproteobacteria bacterium]